MLRIGPYAFDYPVVQAALSGYSDAPMRLLARKFGAPYTIHEVVLDKLVLTPGKHQKKVLTVLPGDHPVGGQLMGADPEQFAAAAALLADRGFDVIDINFGCPVKKVLGRCRGGYLLSDPPTAIEIIRRVRESVPADKPVTLKMRRGMDDTADSTRKFWEIFDAAWSHGLAAITVHGRTVEQKYIGPSNWDFLTEVKRQAGERTILGSGDLFTPHDIKRMLDQTGVDGVTVARGCIGNPWIFRDCRALLAGEELPPLPTVAEQGELIRAHYNLVIQVYDEQQAPKVMRRYGIRYADQHPKAKSVRMAFATAKSADDWEAILNEWYDPNGDWPPPRRRDNADMLITAGSNQGDLNNCGLD